MEDIVLMDAVERYLDGSMPDAERLHFEQLRRESADVDQLVVEHIFFLKQMGAYDENRQFRSRLSAVHEQLVQESAIRETVRPAGKLVSLWNKYKRTVAVAATIAGIISVSVAGLMLVYTKKTGNMNDWDDMKRDMASTKKEVKEIKDSLKKAKNVPMPSANFGGTGFLIDGKGILITNEHVVGRRKSLYIFNEKYGNLKAEVIRTDAANDIAVVKITDTSFKPLKALPYTLKKTEPELGLNIYTLGFPRPELIYNEGYISSRSANGAGSNPANFLLTLRVDAGNSGSPVFNNRGEIVGVINAREKNPNGFAVGIKAKVVADLMDELRKDKLAPAAAGRNTLTGLSRDAQVKKLEDFIFMMEVE
jgi:serine protease Do